MIYDVAIIGAGPVGLFASFQAGMLGMKSCIIDIQDFAGGQCSALYPEKPIYDIPAYQKITGQKLIENLKKQNSPFKPEYFLSRQVSNLLPKNEIIEIETSKNEIIKSKIVLIAAGSGAFGPNRPPLKNIKEFENKSVFYSVINRKRFRNKDILIAGGGDSAVDWALNLSLLANVTIVHRRDKFTAAPSNVANMKELAAQGKINIITNYQLSDLVGSNGKLENVIIKGFDNDSKTIKCNMLLPFFGLYQDFGPLINCGLELKNKHIKVTQPYYETNIKNIYAVGDAATYDGKLKLILTGFAEVASSLHHAYNFVFDGKPLHFEYSTSKGLY